MNTNRYKHDYLATAPIQNAAQYAPEALAAFARLKQHWETAPAPKGLFGLFAKRRYAYHPQRYVKSMVLAAQHNARWMPYTALYEREQGGYNAVQNAIFQSNRLEILYHRPLASGYDHCIGYIDAIRGLAAADTGAFASLLPRENGVSTNGHPAAKAITNTMMGLWYADGNLLDTGCGQLKNRIATKSTTRQVAFVCRYLLCLADGDAPGALASLAEVCATIPRGKGDAILQNHTLARYFVPEVHGLFNLAHYVLPDGTFQKMASFEHSYYNKDYTGYLMRTGYPEPGLYVQYTGELTPLNRLLLHLPTLHVTAGQDKKPYQDARRYGEDMAALLESGFDLQAHFEQHNR